MLNCCTIWEPSQIYTNEYINRLYRAVIRNTKTELRFVVGVSEYQRGLAAGIEQYVIVPRVDYSMAMARFQCWWWPVELMKPGLFNGQVLYLDSDCFVTGSLDWTLTNSRDYIGCADFLFRNSLNLSVSMWRESEFTRALYERLPDVWKAASIYSFGTQDYIMSVRGRKMEYIQDIWPGKVISYKFQYLLNSDLSDVSVVCCPARPKPHEISDSKLRQFWR